MTDLCDDPLPIDDDFAAIIEEEAERLTVKSLGIRDGRKVNAADAVKAVQEVPALDTLLPTSAAALIASDITDPAPLIDGLLYPGTVLTLGALVKTKKTWASLQLMFCASVPIPFLGHAIGRKLRVLYLGGEGSDRTIRRRLKEALGFIPGLKDADLESIGIVCTLGRVKLDTPEGEAWLQRVSEGYDIIIVDPYYRFLSTGSENDHADQRAIQDVFDRLKATGKGIVLVHHLRKPQGTDAGPGELRGAGLDAYSDAILILARKRGGKGRYTLKYYLRHDEQPDDSELEDDGPLLKIAEPLPPKVTPVDLIAAIDAAGGTTPGTSLIRHVRDATEGSKNEAERVLAAAIKADVIGWRRKEGKGQGRLYYVITRPENGG